MSYPVKVTLEGVNDCDFNSFLWQVIPTIHNSNSYVYSAFESTLNSAIVSYRKEYAVMVSAHTRTLMTHRYMARADHLLISDLL